MLIDVHGSGAGYVASPADGTLRDVVRTTAELAKGVHVARRLGVSVEYATQAKAANLAFTWGGPWVDALPRGLRHSLPETVDATVIEGLGRCGMSWLCLGATVPHDDVARLAEVGLRLGLGNAVEVGPGVLRWLETGAATQVTIEGLLTAAVTVAMSLDMMPQQPPMTPQESLLALGRHVTDAPHVAERIRSWGKPVVPLMAATRYAADLSALLTAEGMAELTKVMPHHQRIQALRQPGAMAMGRREALRYLGLRALSSSERRHLADGWAVLRNVLTHLATGGHPLLGGSGAPGLGLHPRYALEEEIRIWQSAGVPESSIQGAFSDPTVSQTAKEHP